MRTGGDFEPDRCGCGCPTVAVVTVAVFDMNETTLDLEPVRAVVDELLAEAGGFTVWFQKLLQLSMAVTATGRPFVDFAALARHAFDAVAATSPGGSAEPDRSFEAVAAAMADLAPYPDVDDALGRLGRAGWTTVALTNSGQDMVESQCANAGLSARFDHIVSVQQVETYKPAPAPYLHVADLVGRDPEDMWMVACHDWDLAGAKAVGMRTAFVRRPRMAWAGIYPDPDLSVRDFGELADELLG